MTTLCIPELTEQDEWFPSLGPQVCDFVEENGVFGPGDLVDQPYRLTPTWRALIERMYQVYPLGARDLQGNDISGRRRFKRVSISMAKGLIKTESASVITMCELHPDAPVRTVDWGSRGDRNQPVGSGVTDPYIPMVAYTVEQTEELAYGALYHMVQSENCPIAGDFDVTLERIMRRDGHGKAVPLASAPDARDGARTTFQVFDETHRFVLPRLKEAYRTMQANIPKRYAADAWTLEVTTAYQPGEASIGEETMDYARSVAEGKVEARSFFFYHRQASEKHDLTQPEGLRAAVLEASGPDGTFRDIEHIINQWEDPRFDRQYGRRVWLNIPTQESGRAFDAEKWAELGRPEQTILAGRAVTLGFDGSRSEDATSIVVTDIITGFQLLHFNEEKPLGPEGDNWSVSTEDVDAAMKAAFERWDVKRLYADPWGWGSEIAQWARRWGTGKDGRVYEWDTRSWAKTAAMVKNYSDAIVTSNGNEGELTHDGSKPFTSAVGNAIKRKLTLKDSNNVPMWVIQKERADSPMKIDAAMAGALSWEARMDAIAAGEGGPRPPVLPLTDGGDEVDERKPEFAGVRGERF